MLAIKIATRRIKVRGKGGRLSHFMIERSHRFAVSPSANHSGWRYCRNTGQWVTDDANNPNPEPKPPRPVSKKADMETGEDMKGE